MEDQLAEYRARKRKELSAGGSLLGQLFKRNKKDNNITSFEDHREENSTQLEASEPQTEAAIAGSQVDNDEKTTWIDYLFPCLYVILWFLLWLFFIEIEFGAVYFVITLCYFMYKNTRTGPRQPNRLSAYSVFNKNQERLDGTFTTEQFEKELRFGPGSVH